MEEKKKPLNKIAVILKTVTILRYNNISRRVDRRKIKKRVKKWKQSNQKIKRMEMRSRN
jgi:hypothetical protein